MEGVTVHCTDWEEGFPGRGDSLNKGQGWDKVYGAAPLRNWVVPLRDVWRQRCCQTGG